MNRPPFIAYSLLFSALNLCFGLILSPLARQARGVFDGIASNTHTVLPAVTIAGLAATPSLHGLAIVFLGIAIVAIVRPTLHRLLIHGLMATLVGTIGVLFVSLWGLLYYVVRLRDHW